MVTGSWLIRGWPVCSSFCLLVPGLSVAGFSVRVMVTGAVTTLSAHTLLIRGSSLVHLFGSGSLAHRLVYLLGSWPLVLHSSVCLSITALSARVVVVGPSARVVVAGPAAGQGRWSCVVRPPVPLSAGPLLFCCSLLVHLFGSWSLVCILDSWSLTCSTVGLSLVHRWCVADLSTRLPLARH